MRDSGDLEITVDLIVTNKLQTSYNKLVKI